MKAKYDPGPFTLARASFKGYSICLGNEEIALVTEREHAVLMRYAPDLYQFIDWVAKLDSACTCREQGWFGEGHAAACVQGDAIHLRDLIVKGVKGGKA